MKNGIVSNCPIGCHVVAVHFFLLLFWQAQKEKFNSCAFKISADKLPNDCFASVRAQ